MQPRIVVWEAQDGHVECILARKVGGVGIQRLLHCIVIPVAAEAVFSVPLYRLGQAVLPRHLLMPSCNVALSCNRCASVQIAALPCIRAYTRTNHELQTSCSCSDHSTQSGIAPAAVML